MIELSPSELRKYANRLIQQGRYESDAYLIHLESGGKADPEQEEWINLLAIAANELMNIADRIDHQKLTCKECSKFLGGGDWNLCCTEKHEDYPNGFLCYGDTPACDKFEFKQKTEDHHV